MTLPATKISSSCNVASHFFAVICPLASLKSTEKYDPPLAFTPLETEPNRN